jgi:hypothetical protein
MHTYLHACACIQFNSSFGPLDTYTHTHSQKPKHTYIHTHIHIHIHTYINTNTQVNANARSANTPEKHGNAQTLLTAYMTDRKHVVGNSMSPNEEVNFLFFMSCVCTMIMMNRVTDRKYVVGMCVCTCHVRADRQT